MFYMQATIYLFGSYARNDARNGSDIDIAIDNHEKISMLELNQMRHMIDVLNTRQRIDLVDFHNVPVAMQTNILKDGVVWKK